MTLHWILTQFNFLYLKNLSKKKTLQKIIIFHILLLLNKVTKSLILFLTLPNNLIRFYLAKSRPVQFTEKLDCFKIKLYVANSKCYRFKVYPKILPIIYEILKPQCCGCCCCWISIFSTVMSGFIAVASWMASARARSWSIGSPSLWIVIFCSTRVSTTPSFSVLYWKKLKLIFD